MSDTILVRFMASHSAKGIQLSAKQVGLLSDNESATKPSGLQSLGSDEEGGDIA